MPGKRVWMNSTAKGEGVDEDVDWLDRKRIKRGTMC